MWNGGECLAHRKCCINFNYYHNICRVYTHYVKGTECLLCVRHLLAAVRQTEMNEGYVTGHSRM